MYCPQCGQQQISDNTRFCSRCGLLIDGVADWIARGGGVRVFQGTQPAAKPLTQKRKGIRRGAKLVFISGVLFPVFMVLSIAADSPGPLIVPFTLFLIGISVLLYSLIFSDDIPLATDQSTVPSRLRSMFGKSALPPAPANVQLKNMQVRTAELVNPPSVTENTTRLLDRD